MNNVTRNPRFLYFKFSKHEQLDQIMAEAISNQFLCRLVDKGSSGFNITTETESKWHVWCEVDRYLRLQNSNLQRN